MTTDVLAVCQQYSPLPTLPEIYSGTDIRKLPSNAITCVCLEATNWKRTLEYTECQRLVRDIQAEQIQNHQPTTGEKVANFAKDHWFEGIVILGLGVVGRAGFKNFRLTQKLNRKIDRINNPNTDDASIDRPDESKKGKNKRKTSNSIATGIPPTGPSSGDNIEVGTTLAVQLAANPALLRRAYQNVTAMVQAVGYGIMWTGGTIAATTGATYRAVVAIPGASWRTAAWTINTALAPLSWCRRGEKPPVEEEKKEDDAPVQQPPMGSNNKTEEARPNRKRTKTEKKELKAKEAETKKLEDAKAKEAEETEKKEVIKNKKVEEDPVQSKVQKEPVIKDDKPVKTENEEDSRKGILNKLGNKIPGRRSRSNSLAEKTPLSPVQEEPTEGSK